MKFSGCIVGLGNPGSRYEDTRHNLGFMAVDYFMHDAGRFSADACSSLSLGKKKYLLWKCFPAGLREPWLVLKPQTYMNLSGEAVAHACDFYNIPAERIVVVHDELDLPLGRMKFKTGGGLAGHNGLKSIAQHLGTKEFHRLRMGIGKPEHGSTADYVLTRFTRAEEPAVNAVLDGALQGLRTFIEAGATSAVQEVNSFDATS